MPDQDVVPVAAREQLEEQWPSLSPEERVEAFRALPRGEAGNFFLARSARSQALLLHAAPPWEKKLLLRMLAPDDAADVLQEFPPEERAGYLDLLDVKTRNEIVALLAYAEDDAGGLMSPRFVRVRPDMTVDEAIAYVRRQTRERAEIIHYLYAVGPDQRLVGVLSTRDLLAAAGERRIHEVMLREFVSVREDTDQEEVARVIADNDLVAVPVVDAEGRMRGIVTVDDIVDVVEDEATEDIQKIGGLEALDKPYLQTRFWEMIRKRAPWLALLFVGEMFTASALGIFEHELAEVLALALFIPLIISSGGNSGSQATTLVVRAMALGEVRSRDWWLVVRREIGTGLTLGVILATIGLLRILVWEGLFGTYGEHAGLLAITIGVSVVAVVAWGSVIGSALPFLLRALRQDPASASAPFVATMVDVSGVVIYFGVARLVLQL